MSDPNEQSADRRRAAAELGAALRDLNEAAVSTEVDVDTLARVAAQVRECVGPLAVATRTRDELPSADENMPVHRTYNPAIGLGNPIAPPMWVEMVDGVAVGSCTLGLIYEGPPRYVHGGVSAMLLDQILGHANAADGHPGMTVRLSVKYRRPVPLQTPLRITGEMSGVDGSGRGEAKAGIATAEEPERLLVQSEGTFVRPSPEQARKLFGESAGWLETRSRVGRMSESGGAAFQE
ncbi:PaaI family thioesterase [Parasphingorhabdus pacifica]